MTDSLRPVPSISCVVPAYNEARHLPEVLPAILAALQALSPRVELIVVDDGSRDDTASVIDALAARHTAVIGLSLSRNFGKEAALTAGLDAASGEVTVIMDADGQHPVALLEPMVRLWREGMDVVYAVRQSRDDQSALQERLTNLFYRLINWGTAVEIPANAGDFRLMGRPVVQALKAMPERNRFMKGLYAWVGFKSTALAYDPLPRLSGRSRFGWKGAFSLAVTGIAAFSSAPLRALAALGLAISLAAFGYGAWVIVEYLFFGIAVPGYATIVAGMMLLAGIQLLGMGVIAEYVARIYDEVKQRPAYFVRNRVGQGLAGAATPTGTGER